MIDEHFEAQLMQAIVRQFFENPPVVGTLPDGTYVNIPPRTTPAQAVAARLLSDKNAELLDSIMEAIDLDVFAASVAAEVLKTLTAPENPHGYGRDSGAEARKRLKDRVDNRLVELMAQDMYARMKDEERASE